MSNQRLGAIAVPILIITVGIGWLLTVQQFGPDINWVWTLGLAVSGLLILLGGVNKFSVVFGPLLIIASLFSVLRQTDRIRFNLELPLLVIALGVLLLIAQHPAIPFAGWMVEGPKGKRSGNDPPDGSA